MRQGAAKGHVVPGDEAVDEEQARHVQGWGGARIEPARRRRDLEPSVEDRKHDEGEPERRGRHPDQAAEPGPVVQPTVPPDSREDAEGHPDGGREDRRETRQLDRRWHVLPNVVEHGPPGSDGLTQVAMGEAPEEDPVLLPERPVEAPAGAELRHQLRVCRRFVAELISVIHPADHFANTAA